MNQKKRSFLITLLVLVVFIGAAALLYAKLSPSLTPDAITPQQSPASSYQPPNTPESSEDSRPEEVLTPDFTVYNKDGDEVKLSDYTGKPVILNFWSSRCGPCRSEMPDFNEIYGEYKDDIHFLMVNMTDGSWDTVDSATDYVEKEGFSFPILYDQDMDAAITFGINALPTTYFIDAEGHLVARAIRALSRDAILEGIGMILPAE